MLCFQTGIEINTCQASKCG